MTGLRIIVCGGRDFDDFIAVRRALNDLHAETPIFAVIHGNARGADRAAGTWARDRGLRCWPVPAEWARDGKRAGPMRNQRMLGMGVDLVVAFPGGRGTEDMVRRAEKAGVPVRRITP